MAVYHFPYYSLKESQICFEAMTTDMDINFSFICLYILFKIYFI